jgi:hypothetical protein
MPAKKGMIMSLNVDPSIQEKMKAVAKRRNISVSKLIRDLVDNNLPDADEEVDVVIFKIPTSMRTTPDSLKQWLQNRIDAVVKALTTS